MTLTDDLEALIAFHDQLDGDDAALVQHHVCSYVRREMGEGAWDYFCEHSDVIP